jgi:hypothetical protein
VASSIGNLYSQQLIEPGSSSLCGDWGQNVQHKGEQLAESTDKDLGRESGLNVFENATQYSSMYILYRSYSIILEQYY